jgi:hypothetical protein
MNMHHAEFGDYQMCNEVVGYEAGRRLAWEPARVAASAEEQEAIGDPARYRWGYELSSDDPGATLVTESFDCSRSPQDLRQAVRDGEGWRAGRHDRVAGQAGTPGQGRRPAHPVGRRATSSPFTRATLPMTVAGVAVAQARPGSAMHLPGSAPAPAGLTAGYRTTFGLGRLRAQNNQLCARQVLCHQAQSAVQIGGSVRGQVTTGSHFP